MSGRPSILDLPVPPDVLSRHWRVGAIGRVAEAGLRGERASREDELFVAGALLAWLENGGSLEKEYLRVTKAKSRITPSVMWQLLKKEAHPDERQAQGDQPKLSQPQPDGNAK